MSALNLVFILGIFHFYQVTANLRCMECVHIRWNRSLTFQGFQTIDNILLSKHNPSCEQRDPFGSTYDQNMQYPIQNPNQGMNGQFMTPAPGVRDTICPTQLGRCGYLYGDVVIQLNTYNVEMLLNMHVRNCMDVPPEMDNRCYDRNSALGNRELLSYFREKLGFLSPDITVKSFVGKQCVCASDMCYPYLNDARPVIVSLWSTFALLVVGILLS
ncbi:uncharacterized protein LOC127830972 [Dreissena polymorpha]|uniref:Uncharacterized protein n=1 Tax=Dreissena polymorpha TaxID=45954 RepID=A0A9D4GT13_DREPO|nr:uncharacterized protein LOC127830972 [Dreissena polymorpha]KAH3822413.1 hypothetical protein DPMN_124191 [Dreissena polymorpha]